MYRIIIFLMVLTIGAAKAEDTAPKSNTLIGFDKIHNGFYAGPELKAFPILNDIGAAIGGRGGWIINNCFSIGGAGYGLVSEVKSDNVNFRYYNNTTSAWQDTLMTGYLHIGWGGLFLEYINSSSSLVHFTVNALVGGGNAGYSEERMHNMDNNNMWQRDGEFRSNNHTEFFVFEPGASAELNVTDFFRISAGVSYRMVSRMGTLGNLKASDLSAVSGNLMFKFGLF